MIHTYYYLLVELGIIYALEVGTCLEKGKDESINDDCIEGSPMAGSAPQVVRVQRRSSFTDNCCEVFVEMGLSQLPV